MAKLLIIRFSAIGDVAMTVPIVHSLAIQYPQLEITVLSRGAMEPLFHHLPKNVSFLSADLAGEYKGWAGLNKLFSRLKAMRFDYVADLHSVVRSHYLTLCFRLAGVTVASMQKGRWDKRKLTRRYGKKLESQKSSFRRYADVLEKLGFPVLLNFTSIYEQERGDFAKIEPVVGTKGDRKWVGIAPFAKHEGKIYPLNLQEQVVAHFAARKDVQLFLFGGGAQEEAVFAQWKEKYPTVFPLCGKLDLSTELILMSHLDVMLSMDSSNMHMASLVNVPVISIWGATHPYAGFLGWKQLPVNTIQLSLPCRPCSVYGNKKCYRGDYACLNGIAPEVVIEKIESIIR